jgi:hypothetical protein
MLAIHGLTLGDSRTSSVSSTDCCEDVHIISRLIIAERSSNNMITATNPLTGEMFDIPDSNGTEIEAAYEMVKSIEKTVAELKDSLKARVKVMAGDDGYIETPNGIYKVSWVQKQTYDKPQLRQLLDEDLLDTFLEVKKSTVDNWLKERVLKNDYDNAVLHSVRQALIPQGFGYEMVKFTKNLRG